MTVNQNGDPPVDDTRTLLVDLVQFIQQYVIMTPDQYIAVALWVLHTHAIDAAYQTPYLSVRSVEKQSGKTRLLEILELLCRRPWLVSRPSEAVTFRTIAARQPTILLDEVDTIWQDKGNEHEGLRALLNAGTRRGVMIPRCVGPNQQVENFPTFCAKALAGIGGLPDTVADRSVPIVMKKRTRDEPVQRFRRRKAEADTEELAQRCARWGAANAAALADAEPELPDELSDRAQDVCEILIAIADTAGDDWARGTRQALVQVITSGQEDETLPLRKRLLADVRLVFAQAGMPEALKSANIVTALNAMDDAPWSDLKDGRGLSASSLAFMLKDYGVAPKQVKALGTKGYRRAHLQDPWNRYLPPLVSPDSSDEPNPAAGSFNSDDTDSPGSVETVSTGFDLSPSLEGPETKLDLSAEYRKFESWRRELDSPPAV